MKVAMTPRQQVVLEQWGFVIISENLLMNLKVSYHAIKDDVTKRKRSASAAHNNTFWPGRCHTLAFAHIANINTKHVDEVSLKLRCNGAHTPISINACISLFRSIVASYSYSESTGKKSAHQFLIFNYGHERNPIHLLHSLHRSRL
jgi:hypothetical protein